MSKHLLFIIAITLALVGYAGVAQLEHRYAMEDRV